MSIRINKYLSESGYCSRREADRLIEQGRVQINGERSLIGSKVSEGDQVQVDGKIVERKKEAIYIAFHKPIGITCTTERKVAGNIIDYINYPERIFPIGRLDKMSEGLIFLTSDGDIVNKILRAGNFHEKEYVVTVDRPIDDRFVEQMAAGVKILDTVTRPCKVVQEGKQRFRIILTQGLNRQIRRMCEALGYRVVTLKRTRIMNMTIGELKAGEWRYFSEKEFTQIQEMLHHSSKTQEASLVDEWE